MLLNRARDWWSVSERLLQDARTAWRAVRREPGFTAVAVITLALGVGATTAVLNVVNQLLLQPLAYPAPDRLAVLFATTPERNVFRDTTSFHDIVAWRDESHAFEGVAAYRQDPFVITGDGPAEPLRGLRASHEFLAVIGIVPQAGRMFNEREQHGAEPVALISDALWRRRYGADPSIVGRTIQLNDVRHVVLGVLPGGFQFLPFQKADVLAPVPERPCRGCGYVRAIARLKKNATPSAAQAELDAIAAGLAKAYPDSNQGRGVNLVPLRELALGDVSTPLMVLLGAGLFVLLIGCANVGNLVLARSLGRQREIGVRCALGARRGRLVWHSLAESISLALASSIAGGALAVAGSRLLSVSLQQRFSLPEVPFDWTLFAIAASIAVLSGLLSGLPAALMVWRSDLSGWLRQDARTQSGDLSQHRLRNLLVVSQTALTVMLLVGAALLVQSFVRLQQVDIGVNPRLVLTADLLLSSRYGDADRREAFIGDVMRTVGALPGIQNVAFQTDSAFFGGGSQQAISIEGLPDPGPKVGHTAAFNQVGGDILRSWGMTLVRGRPFDARDSRNAPPVALVNERMARQFWPNDTAIGKRIRFYYDEDRNRWITIVGVVRDANYRYEDSRPKFFVPFGQELYRQPRYWRQAMITLVLRTSTPPSGLASAVQTAVWSIDRDQPILNLETMDQILWQSVAAQRIYMLLIGIFASIALVIASAGIYGVSAYAVVRRTREIGIRLAVGATPRQIIAMVLRGGMGTIITGLTVGVIGSLALTRVTSAFLYGIEATDPMTFMAVIALFAATAAMAIYVAARRASRIDPTIAFRFE